jgi:hypothetical protein
MMMFIAVCLLILLEAHWGWYVFAGLLWFLHVLVRAVGVK